MLKAYDHFKYNAIKTSYYNKLIHLINYVNVSYFFSMSRPN